MARVDTDTENSLQATDVESDQFRDVVGELVTGVAILLRRHAEVLRPFMLLAASDEQIAVRGRQSARLMTSLFISLLAQRCEAIRHPDPGGASEWCFILVYSVVARRLGLGSTTEGSAMEGANDDWDALIKNLTDTVTAYLSLAH